MRWARWFLQVWVPLYCHKLRLVLLSKRASGAENSMVWFALPRPKRQFAVLQMLLVVYRPSQHSKRNDCRPTEYRCLWTRGWACHRLMFRVWPVLWLFLAWGARCERGIYRARHHWALTTRCHRPCVRHKQRGLRRQRCPKQFWPNGSHLLDSRCRNRFLIAVPATFRRWKVRIVLAIGSVLQIP